jgi:RNA methyltransferase, TrmH family
MERVTSRHNAVVKRFRDLARSADVASGELLLDGAHLVQEALACGIPIEIAAFSDRQLASARAPLAQVAAEVKRQGGRVVGVTDQVLAAMSPVEHPSGVVAIGHARPSTVDIAFSATSGTKPVPTTSDVAVRSRTSDVAGRPTSDVESPLVVVLAGLQDPGNVGAIVRTAAACGATGLVTLDGSANPFGWKALRGAMGGTFRLPVAARAQLHDVIAAARARNVRLIAAVPQGGTPLPAIDLRRPSAVMLGSEGAGVSQAVADAAAELVTVPMRRPIESLNVAVAAALILYEASRQRQDQRK